MKKFILILGTIVGVSLTGCATKEYVRSQVDPLTERSCNLEAKEAELRKMRENDSAAIKQANDKAQQALDLANKNAGDLMNANNDIKKIEAMALRAEKAANDATQAAKEAGQAANEARQMATKSEKVFKLQQKK